VRAARRGARDQQLHQGGRRGQAGTGGQAGRGGRGGEQGGEVGGALGVEASGAAQQSHRRVHAARGHEFGGTIAAGDEGGGAPALVRTLKVDALAWHALMAVSMVVGLAWGV